MRATRPALAFSGLAAVFVAGAALSQPAPLGPPIPPPSPIAPAPLPAPDEPRPPTAAERQAAVREYALPTGIGGCILREIDPAVRTSVLTSLGLGQGLPATFTPAVSRISEECTGRPYSASDRALAAAAQGAALRAAVAIYFASELAIGEHRLDAVWKSAPASEKAPFLNSARLMLDPQAQPTAPTLADAVPLARRLQIKSNEPGRLAPVHQYYLGVAFSELAEAQLAAEGAQPP